MSPIAEAGPAQPVHVNTIVQLDGSGSYDPDGDAITAWLWSLVIKPAQSAAALSSPSIARPTFTADKPGAYVVELKVYDGNLWSAIDSVTITAVNQCPVADAGNNQTETVGQTVTLDGSASHDPDGDAITYSWTLITPQGSTAALNNTISAKPSFTPDKPGVFTATLTVNDGICISPADSVIVTISEANPMPGCDDGPLPDPPCQMKTDYKAGTATGDAVKIYSYKDYQKYEASNYGYANGKYKGLKVMSDITMSSGDLLMHSPGAIEICSNVRLKATSGVICLDGRTGVKCGASYLEADDVALLSETGDVSLGNWSHVNADFFYLRAAGTAQLSNGMFVTVSGPVTVLSTGTVQASEATIGQSVAIKSQALFMQSKGSVTVSEGVDLNIAGPVRLVSTGEKSGSSVSVKQGAAVTAWSLCVTGAEDVSLGPGSMIGVHELTVASTGGKSASKASIKPLTVITASEMSLMGQKAWLEPMSILWICGSFNMEAEIAGGCSVKGYYWAKTTSGNCLR